MSGEGWSSRGDIGLLLGAMTFGTATLVALVLMVPALAAGFAAVFLYVSLMLVRRSWTCPPLSLAELRVRRLAKTGIRAAEEHLRVLAAQQPTAPPGRVVQRRRQRPRGPIRRRRWSRRP